eukprot:scaffold15907_cov183-Amphora_coffeaeformis.AAC.3
MFNFLTRRRRNSTIDDGGRAVVVEDSVTRERNCRRVPYRKHTRPIRRQLYMCHLLSFILGPGTLLQRCEQWTTDHGTVW